MVMIDHNYKPNGDNHGGIVTCKNDDDDDHDVYFSQKNKRIHLEAFDSCRWGVGSSVPLLTVFPWTLLVMVWNISQILANKVDIADKLVFEQRRILLRHWPHLGQCCMCWMGLGPLCVKLFYYVVAEPSHLKCFMNSCYLLLEGPRPRQAQYLRAQNCWTLSTEWKYF